jgi:hypothetical protein
MDAVKRVQASFAMTNICRELGMSTATFYKLRLSYLSDFTKLRIFGPITNLQKYLRFLSYD